VGNAYGLVGELWRPTQGRGVCVPRLTLCTDTSFSFCVRFQETVRQMFESEGGSRRGLALVARLVAKAEWRREVRSGLKMKFSAR